MATKHKVKVYVNGQTGQRVRIGEGEGLDEASEHVFSQSDDWRLEGSPDDE